jgi:hypothetical protein
MSRTLGGVVSNFTNIAVAPNGKVCSDPGGLSTADLSAAGASGTITVADIEQVRINLTAPGLGSMTSDQADGRFLRYRLIDLLASTRGSIGGLGTGFPSLGCLVYPFSINPSDPLPGFIANVPDPVPQQSLNAGAAMNLSGPLGAMQILRRGSAQTGSDPYKYKANLGGSFNNAPNYLEPGNYTLDLPPGGPDVGSFHTSLVIPSSRPVWTNANAFGNIMRSQDQTITWSGGAAGGLTGIVGASADPKLGAGMQFYCTERADAGQFTLPSWVLSAMPATGQSQTALLGTFGFGSALQPSRFQGNGVSVGFFNWVTLQAQAANYQ